jgi:diacylglycerol kinase
LTASFGWALAGIWEATKTQRNMRIHWAAAAVAAGMGAWLGLSAADWAAVALSCALVMAAECMNTALEATVDLASPERHPLAKRAKDCAAGAVLLCALGAVAVGVAVFGPKLVVRF